VWFINFFGWEKKELQHRQARLEFSVLYYSCLLFLFEPKLLLFTVSFPEKRKAFCTLG
jgi:hypothetical protein